MRAIHWFRSDLRLRDNEALALAARRAEQILLLFVLDDALLANPHAGQPRVRFLHDCLSRLRRDLEQRGVSLVIRRGDPGTIVPSLAERVRATLVTWNRDYSPYAKRRDGAVARALARRGVTVHTCKDRVVFESSETRTRAGGSYSVYGPYRRAWWNRYHQEFPAEPGSLRLPPPIPGISPGAFPSPRELGCSEEGLAAPAGGEAAATRRLRSFLEHDVARYAEARDYPAQEATSRLSPYLRFGAISVRRAVREAEALARALPEASRGVAKWLDELVWREFYHAILDAYPHVLRRSFRRSYDHLKWNDDPEGFAAWRDGRTGYPFVDAAMRELRTTGSLHNRARMVVASFLVKDLLIDWREGERYFMQRLVDGDPASNNGGWQWAASTGTDAQPYFRIFNPVTQAERFDPDGTYVRRWVPELRDLPAKLIHRPWEAPLRAPRYPKRIVDHEIRRHEALERFASIRHHAPAATRRGLPSSTRRR